MKRKPAKRAAPKRRAVPSGELNTQQHATIVGDYLFAGDVRDGREKKWRPCDR